MWHLRIKQTTNNIPRIHIKRLIFFKTEKEQNVTEFRPELFNHCWLIQIDSSNETKSDDRDEQKNWRKIRFYFFYVCHFFCGKESINVNINSIYLSINPNESSFLFLKRPRLSRSVKGTCWDLKIYIFISQFSTIVPGEKKNFFIDWLWTMKK